MRDLLDHGLVIQKRTLENARRLLRGAESSWKQEVERKNNQKKPGNFTLKSRLHLEKSRLLIFSPPPQVAISSLRPATSPNNFSLVPEHQNLTFRAEIPNVPYPQRLKNYQKDKQFAKFIEIYKKLYINILFADALAQMPSYAKFMKHVLSNK